MITQVLISSTTGLLILIYAISLIEAILAGILKAKSPDLIHMACCIYIVIACCCTMAYVICLSRWEVIYL